MISREQKSIIYIKDSSKMESFIHRESVDLIISGPPYWTEVCYGDSNGQLSKESEYDVFLKKTQYILEQCEKVLKPGSVLAFWLHDFYRANKHDQNRTLVPFHADIIKIMPANLEFRHLMIWDRYVDHKLDTFPKLDRISPRFQYVIIFQKSGTNPLLEEKITRSLARLYWQPVWKYKTNPTVLGSRVLFRFLYKIKNLVPKIIRGLLAKLTIRYFKDQYTFSDYTTECPPEVAQLLISMFSNENDHVLDPFAGSCTSAIASFDQRRNFIGFEVERKALYSIKKRLTKYSKFYKIRY